ncbi:MAG: hypothetical protein CM15mP59_3910 [Flavobacteriaceae bacterium]|nr:MAG: hypothetical protein CM15mP59_3910 [Flavobacteriaceae bacterium]
MIMIALQILSTSPIKIIYQNKILKKIKIIFKKKIVLDDFSVNIP